MSKVAKFQAPGGTPLEQWQEVNGGFRDVAETEVVTSEGWESFKNKNPQVRLFDKNGKAVGNTQPCQLTKAQLDLPGVKFLVNAEGKPILRKKGNAEVLHEEPFMVGKSVIMSIDSDGKLIVKA